MMTEETTTEQLAEIEGQTESTPATEYTPPEGWQEVPLGEPLKGGDEYHAGLDRYIRPIEPQPQPQPQPDSELQAQVVFLKGREVTLGTRLQQEREVTTRLRGELESVQVMLGESRQRVTQLEELVASLRTINEGAEKAVSGAGVVNDSLRLQLAAVKAELVTQAETSRRLQIELDAAQQVPPAIADRFQEGWNQGTARAVETVLEWLEPIRLVDSAYLANATMQHLPQIMRHLTGLDSHAID